MEKRNTFVKTAMMNLGEKIKMNEAETILRREMEKTQFCIKNLEISIETQQDSLKERKKELQEIIDGLMCLEGEKE